MFHVKQVRYMKLSAIFFWLFLVSLPFNRRVIYNPSHAYIGGYFSYYLAIFLYLSDILLIICFLTYLVEKRGVLKARKAWFWPTLAFILAGSLGLFHVQHDKIWSIYSVLKILEMIFLVSFVSSNFEILKFRFLAWVIWVSAIFQAMLGIWQFHVQHSIGVRILGEYIAPLGTGGLSTLDTVIGKVIRAYGTFPHPNVYGTFLEIGLILGYFLVFSRETSKKLQIFVGIGDYLLILGIFLSFSRVSWAITAFATIATVWYLKGRKKELKLAVFIPPIVACATILALWHGLLFSRVVNIQDTNSYIDRGTLNHAGIEIFKAYPIFGTGFGNYIPVMEELFHVSASPTTGRQPWEYQPSHNIFIYTAASTGIIGLVLFLWMLWKIFSSTWNTPKSDLKFALLVLGTSLLFGSLFDHFLVTIQQGQLMFALSLGLMLGYAYKD